MQLIKIYEPSCNFKTIICIILDQTVFNFKLLHKYTNYFSILPFYNMTIYFHMSLFYRGFYLFYYCITLLRVEYRLTVTHTNILTIRSRIFATWIFIIVNIPSSRKHLTKRKIYYDDKYAIMNGSMDGCVICPCVCRQTDFLRSFSL